MRKGRILRRLTIEECPWLEESIDEGATVFEWIGYTYGCIASGIPVSEKPGVEPFFEIPLDSVKWDKS